MSAAMFQRRASPLKGWGLTGSPGKERHRAAVCSMNHFRLNQLKWTHDIDLINLQYSVQRAEMLLNILGHFYKALSAHRVALG